VDANNPAQPPSVSPAPSMARGYGWSIIFLLGVVFSLISAAVYQVVKIVRAETAREALRAANSAKPQPQASGQ
jgi:hypothetical protein